jgi:MFS family permease
MPNNQTTPSHDSAPGAPLAAEAVVTAALTGSEKTPDARDADGRGGGAKLPRELRRLFATAPVASAVAPLMYAVAAYFVALQVQIVDNDGKVGALAVVNTVSAVAALIAQPVIGVLSDRTRTRFGTRRPWMLVGALIGSVGLITAGLSASVAVLVVAMMLVQFGFNALQGPLGALLPDRVPVRFRGRYSTLVGLGSLLAAIVGPVLASLFAEAIPTGYFVFTGVALFAVTGFVILNPERDSRGEPRAPFSASAFLRAFWVNPVRHPDFFWAFLGRFLIFGGYGLITVYGFYIAQDYIGLSMSDAARIGPLVGLAGLPGFLVSTAISGPLSDRLGRRKPMVLIGGLIVSVSAVVPLLLPTLTGMFVSGAIATIGVGAFISVDQALISEVLPNKDDFAKDLGVINIAATLPNTIAPVLAGGIVTLTGGYAALYGAVVLITALGALAVLPIKSVR